uniref:Uncharacterized protein n=1 Tax=Avena sativa TaxID=4498 RepID=A0ACD5XUS2_AVESA
MRTLHHEARQAKAKPAPAPAEEAFTARELDAAEQLIHLSGSSSSSGPPKTAGRAPAASSSSSPRSVNAPPVPALAPASVPLGVRAGWEEDQEREVAGSQRRVRRYRLIAEIYAATEEIEVRGGGGSNRKKKNKKKLAVEIEIERGGPSCN